MIKTACRELVLEAKGAISFIQERQRSNTSMKSDGETINGMLSKQIWKPVSLSSVEEDN